MSLLETPPALERTSSTPDLLGVPPTPDFEELGPPTVTAVSRLDELHSLRDEWQDLADHASTPNSFYEPWNVLAAIEHLPGPSDPIFLFVHRAASQTAGAPRLCGFLPLHRERASRFEPARWAAWGHPYCFLRTPLLRRGHERDVLQAIVDWARHQRRRPSILSLPNVDGEGPFAQAVVDVCHADGMICVPRGEYTRALLRRSPDWQPELNARITSHHKRELRRQWRRLSEQGQLRFRLLHSLSELDYFTQAFLEMEAAGWKGREQTAFAEDPSTRDYFVAMTRAAFHANRLEMLGLFLNNEPVALKVNLLAGDGAFAFKIAYDEAWSRYSPGVHLELEAIRHFQEDTSQNWFDSCATANHFMINRLWGDRRIIRHLLLPNARVAGHLATCGLPLLRGIKRVLKTPLRAAAK